MNILRLLALSSILTLTSFSEEIGSELDVKYSNFSTTTCTNELVQNFNLGFSNTTGNTNNLDVNAKYDLSYSQPTYKARLLKIVFDSSVFFTKTDSEKTNEEYLVNLGLEQDLGKHWLSYFAFNWLRNPEFKNYAHKVSVGTGLGKDIFFDGSQSITLKLGTAYNQEKYANNQASDYSSSLNEYIEYQNQLNKISKLYLKIGSLQHFGNLSDDYEVLSILGVLFSVGEKINLSIEQELAYDNLPPVGFKKTDTKSIVRLGYKF